MIKDKTDKKTTPTMRQYYRFHLMVRSDSDHLHKCGELFQQYLVDQWAKIESDDLCYLKKHQLRIDRASSTKFLSAADFFIIKRFNDNKFVNVSSKAT